MPRIIQMHSNLGIANDIEVVFRKIRRDDTRDEWLDLGNRLLLDHWIDRYRASGHSSAAANHEHARRVHRHQGRNMTEHALKTHVLWLARRLNLPRVVIVDDAAWRARYGDRSRDAFADVHDLVDTYPRRRKPPIRDEEPWQGRYGAREKNGGDAHHAYKSDCCARAQTLSRVLAGREADQEQETGHSGDPDEHLLGHLTADGAEKHEAADERSDNRADRVGCIHAAHEPARIH